MNGVRFKDLVKYFIKKHYKRRNKST